MQLSDTKPTSLRTQSFQCWHPGCIQKPNSTSKHIFLLLHSVGNSQVRSLHSTRKQDRLRPLKYPFLQSPVVVWGCNSHWCYRDSLQRNFWLYETTPAVQAEEQIPLRRQVLFYIILLENPNNFSSTSVYWWNPRETGKISLMTKEFPKLFCLESAQRCWYFLQEDMFLY